LGGYTFSLSFGCEGKKKREKGKEVAPHLINREGKGGGAVHHRAYTSFRWGAQLFFVTFFAQREGEREKGKRETYIWKFFLYSHNFESLDMFRGEKKKKGRKRGRRKKKQTEEGGKRRA